MVTREHYTLSRGPSSIVPLQALGTGRAHSLNLGVADLICHSTIAPPSAQRSLHMGLDPLARDSLTHMLTLEEGSEEKCNGTSVHNPGS